MLGFCHNPRNSCSSPRHLLKQRVFVLGAAVQGSSVIPRGVIVSSPCSTLLCSSLDLQGPVATLARYATAFRPEPLPPFWAHYSNTGLCIFSLDSLGSSSSRQGRWEASPRSPVFISFACGSFSLGFSFSKTREDTHFFSLTQR